MATYELVVEETGRFEVVDASERPYTVVERTECLSRVSVTKRYPPVKGEVRYWLLDGTPLRRSNSGFFDTPDGLRRFFVVRKVETRASAC